MHKTKISSSHVFIATKRNGLSLRSLLFQQSQQVQCFKNRKKNCDDTDTVFKVEEIKIIGRKKKINKETQNNRRCPQECASLILHPIFHFYLSN